MTKGMKNYIGNENIGSPVSVQDTGYKGKKIPFYKSMAAVTALTLGLGFAPACYAADTAPAKQVQTAQKPAKASTIPQKKIRILVKAFEPSGETQSKETKYFLDSTRTAYSGNEGAAIRDAIINELMDDERRGWFNKKGLYSLVEDTERPDSEEAELAVKGTFYRSGADIHFLAKLVKTRTGEIVYTKNFTLPDSPGEVTSGGKFIADGLGNYLP